MFLSGECTACLPQSEEIEETWSNVAATKAGLSFSTRVHAVHAVHGVHF